MTTPSIGQPFPSIPAPFVRVIDDKTGQVIAHGQIEQIWLQLLIALWNRTGGAPGVVTAAALIEAFLAETEIPSGNTSEALNGLLSDGSAAPSSPSSCLESFVCEVVEREIERLGLLAPARDIASPLLAFLMASDEASSDDLASDDDSTSWVPLVTGAEPPVLVSNGAGALVFVAWHP